MKNIVPLLIILPLLNAPVFAQEIPGCFLINETGNMLKLTELCPESEKPLTENTETPKTETPNPETPPPESPPNNNTPENTEKNGQNQVNFFAVPIKKRVGGIPLIEVTFNGTKTFEMLLDTGATITTITPTMVNELNFIPEQNIPVKTAAGIMETQIGKVNSILAGNLKINNVSVAVTPSLSWGLLGQNFYQNYDLNIKKNVIEFSPRN